METVRKGDLFVMPGTEQRKYTITDIEALPEGKRAELLDGELYMMASPGRRHQDIVMDLSYLIKDHIVRENGVCRIYPAPFGVYLSGDDRNYVEPDISVICDKSKLTDKGCVGAPDWIIEVVSDSSRLMDYHRKLFKYRTAGVREYWIADPDRQKVTVYHFEHERVEEYGFRDRVKAEIYEGFEIDFSEVGVE